MPTIAKEDPKQVTSRTYGCKIIHISFSKSTKIPIKPKHSNNKAFKIEKGKSFQKFKNLGPSQLTPENHYHMPSD